MRRGRPTFFGAIVAAVMCRIVGRGRRRRSTTLRPMSADDRQFWAELHRCRQARGEQGGQP